MGLEFVSNFRKVEMIQASEMLFSEEKKWKSKATPHIWQMLSWNHFSFLSFLSPDKHRSSPAVSFSSLSLFYYKIKNYWTVSQNTTDFTS